MADYRIYTLTDRHQIKTPPAVIECENDQEAVELAHEMVNGHVIELWQGARFVTMITTDDNAVAASK